MTTIYDVIAERHRVWNGHEFAENPKPEVILFYDEDRETAVRFMQKYDKQHGFTMEDKGMTTTIANLILRERYSTGEEISRTPYCEIFDENRNRREP